MVNEKKVLQMLSLCSKAGKVASGEFQCEDAVRRGTACVVLVSGDASDNTCKKFSNKCEFYEVPFYKLSCDKEDLGRAIGKEKRSCVAVTDGGLAGALLKNLKENE
ncbi:MAG: ribosomal L7Ae/L30e/S12e/Gadd45 family protein [Firmicutes bacterium]|nr:ribosomal L7Ae/L30e/S12e/Gadd45 family protein [Bacillota bacterium]